MKYLDELLKNIEVIFHQGDLHREVTGVGYDTRRLDKGNLFVAIRGFKRDGHDFLDEAIFHHAAAIISELKPPERFSNSDIAWVQVPNDRQALSRLSAAFFDYPSGKTHNVGVTGTNGKTTVMSLIASILSHEGPTATIGTLGMDFPGITRKMGLTTPESVDIFRFLADARERGCKNLVMEASSAALKLHRLDGICFSQAIFTTFSGDHLDFHHTMEDYFESKMRLFENLNPEGWAVIDIDDPSSARVIERLECKYITYGFSGHADVSPLSFRLSLPGIEAQVRTPRGNIEIKSPLIGKINLSNILAAISSAVVKGTSFEHITAGLRDFRPVRGRLDIAFKGDFTVLIDYAHTDQALEGLLLSLREVVQGKIILVFGAGGSRDKTKRPRMGQAASRYSDFVVVTSDNPREEEPQAIIADIICGFVPGLKDYIVEVDREEAIRKALYLASPGDLVVIAGKGHEDYQIFRDQTIHFDDYEVVERIVANRGGG